MRTVLLPLASLLALCCQAQVRLSTAEARKNLIDPVPVIRVPGSEPFRVFVSVQVTLVVDTNGQVRSAEPVVSSRSVPRFLETVRALQARLVPRAVEMVKALKYRPFVRNGAAVEVQYDEYVRILPLEKVPMTHVPFPSVDDLKSVEFWLSRGVCFGSCPVYEVHITGEGVVSLVGAPYDGLLGELNKRASPDAIQALIESFRKADFFSLDDRYQVGATDLSMDRVGIRIDTASKTVIDYGGEEVGMPAVVADLEHAIDVIMYSVKDFGLARL